MPSDAHSWAGFEHRNFGGHYTFAGGGSLTFTAAVPEGASAEGLNANFNFFDFRPGGTGLTVPANLEIVEGVAEYQIDIPPSEAAVTHITINLSLRDVPVQFTDLLNRRYVPRLTIKKALTLVVYKQPLR